LGWRDGALGQIDFAYPARFELLQDAVVGDALKYHTARRVASVQAGLIELFRTVSNNAEQPDEAILQP
jgi:hypothetical protein